MSQQRGTSSTSAGEAAKGTSGQAGAAQQAGPTTTAAVGPTAAGVESAPASPAPTAPAPAPVAPKAEPKTAKAEPPKAAPLTLPPRSGTARPTQKATGASKRVAGSTPKPDTPREVCGSRTNFSLLWCMQAQCRLPAFTSHPQCRELRRTGDVS
jgi:hypothetical protein